jgi:periplasmic protein CpxP/Spy
MKTKSLNLSVKSFFTMILLGCLLSIGQTLNAQEAQKTSEDQAKNLTEKMKEKLSLDDQQYSKGYDINLKYIKKGEELKNSSASRRSKLKTFKSNQDAKDKEVKGVLNDEQYKEYQKLKEQLKEELKEKAKENRNKQS